MWKSKWICECCFSSQNFILQQYNYCLSNVMCVFGCSPRSKSPWRPASGGPPSWPVWDLCWSSSSVGSGRLGEAPAVSRCWADRSASQWTAPGHRPHPQGKAHLTFHRGTERSILRPRQVSGCAQITLHWGGGDGPGRQLTLLAGSFSLRDEISLQLSSQERLSESSPLSLSAYWTIAHT